MQKAPFHPWNRRQFLQAAGAGLLGWAWPDRLSAQAPEEKPLPPRRAADPIDGPPVVSAKAWAVAEGKSGRVLWGSHQSDALNMASTTKIMTTFLVLRLAGTNAKVLNESMVISDQAAKTGGSSARIRAGDRFTVRDLLYGLLLPSGNDAAVALAEHFGSRFGAAKTPTAGFVAEMNRQAGAFKMAETRYFDPHGMGKNHTSARDLATLASHAMQIPLFREYVQTRRHRCDVADAKGQKRTLFWNNTNKLLDIEGYDGIKTGTTTAAGFCLVASGRRKDDHLFVVVLGATSNDSRYVDSRNLFRWAWRQRGHT